MAPPAPSKYAVPVFFCDNCGAEVSQTESSCPNCKRIFASIRCPACGFSGAERLFDDGCPRCGYKIHGTDKNVQKTRRDDKNNKNTPYIPMWLAFPVILLAALLISLLIFHLV